MQLPTGTHAKCSRRVGRRNGVSAAGRGGAAAVRRAADACHIARPSALAHSGAAAAARRGKGSEFNPLAAGRVRTPPTRKRTRTRKKR
ncbi:hypothetical protein EVAR_33914_1 [Eumeta japonica]|uniref:Uncharacterized protein n=1 Tax=Eumeta variegata TaxID=151549 RepID=A0A4C1VVX4_EUMVA|nr:hypothetical protein EVAR_33914_1 [Eumeta japonica]